MRVVVLIGSKGRREQYTILQAEQQLSRGLTLEAGGFCTLMPTGTFTFGMRLSSSLGELFQGCDEAQNITGRT